ncbi:MAG: hypothetical protein ACRBBQ_16090 [Cognatishimia sp.]
MKRVLPVIFVGFGVVGFAVLQSHGGSEQTDAILLSAAQPVVVDLLTQ